MPCNASVVTRYRHAYIRETIIARKSTTFKESIRLQYRLGSLHAVIFRMGIELKYVSAQEPSLAEGS